MEAFRPAVGCRPGRVAHGAASMDALLMLKKHRPLQAANSSAQRDTTVMLMAEMYTDVAGCFSNHIS
jgi:hypothetical protein